MKKNKKSIIAMQSRIDIPDSDSTIIPLKVDHSKLTDEELDAPLVPVHNVMLPYTGKVIKGALKVIKEKCLDCSCWQANEVKFCPATDCTLFPFRNGKNPYSVRELSSEQKVQASDRMKEVRKKRKV
jgi:hypothetical protein